MWLTAMWRADFAVDWDMIPPRLRYELVIVNGENSGTVSIDVAR